jgi:hypothetical protein
MLGTFRKACIMIAIQDYNGQMRLKNERAVYAEYAKYAIYAAVYPDLYGNS